DLDGLVGHGPFHEALVEPARRERQRAAVVEPGEQGVAVGPRQALDVVGRLRVAGQSAPPSETNPACCGTVSDRATGLDRRSPHPLGDLRSARVARSGDRATTAGDKRIPSQSTTPAAPLLSCASWATRGTS